MFWRKEPLSKDEKHLMDELYEAHWNAAHRENPSSVAIVLGKQSGVGFLQSLTAAISMIGGHHAPIEAITLFLQSATVMPDIITRELLVNESKIPGWGNSFVKGERDPLFRKVEQTLVNFPIYDVMVKVTDYLHDFGKKIYPNPGGYTAAAALALGCPIELTPYLFLDLRLAPLAAIWFNTK